jgi:PAS domain S-box-containing protein
VKPHKPEWLREMEGILETLNEGVLIVDDCHQIVFANDSMARIWGYRPAELLGRTANYFYRGADLAFLNEQVARREHAGSNRFEFFLPRPGGDRVPVIISSRVIEDPEGREFVVITFTDITEQKRAEASLREANRELEKRQQEIEQDLALASRVQQSLAPSPLRWGPFAVEAFYHPVSTIGGDFGLVTPFGDGQLNLVVCDVSGHGISSALIANRIYSETISLLERRAELDEMLGRLNRFILQQIRVPGFYFSLAAARVRAQDSRLTFANAGHPPAIWIRGTGSSSRLESRSTVLGILPDAVSPDPTQEVELARGDRVVLYTDGLIEVFNDREEMLGVEGLEEIAGQAARLPLPEMVRAILDRVEAWRHGPPRDDVSLIVLERA